MSKIHAEWLIFNAEAQKRRGWVDASFTIHHLGVSWKIES